MALPAATSWDVRTTGSANNGGGFVLGASGTDYSAQDAAQYALTGIASAGSGNTVLSAAAAADMVGNIAQVISGTNFNTGFFEVVSVSVGVSITFGTNNASQSICSGVGASGVINIGGGLTLITTAEGQAVAGNIINIKSGTYTISTGLTVPQPDITYIGYGTSHGDGGTKPLITTSTNNVDIFTDIASGATGAVLNNLSLSSTAGTPGYGIAARSRVWTGLSVINCKLSGFLHGIDGDDNVTFYMHNVQVFNTEITACVVGIACSAFICDCYIHDNTGDGWTLAHAVENGIWSQFCRSVFANNGGKGIDFSSGSFGGIFIENCVFYNNTSDGVLVAGTLHAYYLGVFNSIFYLNGGYGLNVSSATASVQPCVNQNNAYGANTSGARNLVNAGSGDVALSGDPFTNASGGDFTLNNTSGAGAACRGAGFQL